MKRCFQSINFKPSTRELIDVCNGIVDEYQAQSMRLTLRQVYYQMIGRDLFPDSWIDPIYNAKHGLPPDTKNTEKNYKHLGSILSDARLAGLTDWDAIEDRARQPTIWQDYASLKELAEDAIRTYRLPRWEGQDEYVELWIEKDALASVLQPVASRYHVTLMINRGYSSSSAMYEAAQRLMLETNQPESEFYDGDKPTRSPTVLYLGDFDPSGEDMVRDVRERLELFGVMDLMVKKVALTMAQVRQYNPPPNPAKACWGRQNCSRRRVFHPTTTSNRSSMGSP